MKRLNSNIKPRIVKVCGKSVLFELSTNEYAYASKRVANDILGGCEDIYYEEVAIPNRNVLGSVTTQVWLSTPNRF